MAWIAEKRPELLVGGAATAAAFNEAARYGRPNRSSLLGAPPESNYARIADMAPSADRRGGSGVSTGGDTLNYYGVAPESLIQRWRADQQRQRVLRGVR
jgi:hypothetical protein